MLSVELPGRLNVTASGAAGVNVNSKMIQNLTNLLAANPSLLTNGIPNNLLTQIMMAGASPGDSSTPPEPQKVIRQNPVNVCFI